jgi:DNA-binding Lrp family transcriptional regulator
MDPLDFSIYRYLSPGGEARFWAGRRVIDPSIPAREIAARVGISENGVRARLRSLAERGFLRGRAVTPNPSLFGVQVWVLELPVEGPVEVERIYRDLALVEGVIFARDTLDEQDRQVRVHFVSDSEPTARRRAALLHRLSPTGLDREPQPYLVPPCSQELSPLDWRLLQALDRHPEAGIGELAHTIGISIKTAARRHHQLIDSRACWYTHAPDCEEFPLALVRLDVRDSAERDVIATSIARETAAWMPVARDGLGLEEAAAATTVAGLVPADAPVVLERTVAGLAARAGIRNIRRTFALGSRAYPTWLHDQLAERVPPVRASSPPDRSVPKLSGKSTVVGRRSRRK